MRIFLFHWAFLLPLTVQAGAAKLAEATPQPTIQLQFAAYEGVRALYRCYLASYEFNLQGGQIPREEHREVLSIFLEKSNGPAVNEVTQNYLKLKRYILFRESQTQLERLPQEFAQLLAGEISNFQDPVDVHLRLARIESQAKSAIRECEIARESLGPEWGTLPARLGEEIEKVERLNLLAWNKNEKLAEHLQKGTPQIKTR